MKFKEIVKRNKRRYVLETDMAEMRFLIAACTCLLYSSYDCYRCSFETCCQSRLKDGKRDLCDEITELKKGFIASVG